MQSIPTTAHSLIYPAAVIAALGAALHYVLPSGIWVVELGPGLVACTLRRYEILSVCLLTVQESSQPESLSSCECVAQCRTAQLPLSAQSIGGLCVLDTPGSPELLLNEAKRVLISGGLLVTITADEVATDITNHIQVGWETILQRNAVTNQPPASGYAQLQEAVGISMTAVHEIAVCRWSEITSPQQKIEWNAEVWRTRLPKVTFDK